MQSEAYADSLASTAVDHGSAVTFEHPVSFVTVFLEIDIT